MTKYDLWKSSLMVSTTRERSATPDPSPESSTTVSGASTFEGERKNEAAIPKSSELYQATLSSAFSASGSDDSGLEEEEEELLLGFSLLHRNLYILGW